MPSIKEAYVKTLQNYQDKCLVRASIWTFRTIRDLRSLSKKSKVLTTGDRVAIFFRGMLAILIWLPVNLIAIPYILIKAAQQRKHSNPRQAKQLHEILPGLYLGTIQAAKSEAILKKHNISSVLSIIDEEIEVPKNLVSNHERISIEDFPHVDLTPAIKRAKAFYKQEKENKRNVLVHCNMGMSRSASIVTALVQKNLKIGPQKALEHVKKKRRMVDLNYGFKQQLLRQPIKKIPIPKH